MIRIGYACINTTLPSTNKTCRVANASPDRVIELARQNLIALAEILRWNDAQGIRLFRISSEIIPLASHPAVSVPWEEILRPELEQAGTLARQFGIRLSMHPGQYTVLNSPRPEVVEASLAELEYHARFLSALGMDHTAKLVLHLGGVYGEKDAAMERFAANFARLSEDARRRLVLENDERSYTAADALALSARIGAPVVFDVFHHRYNPSLEGLPLRAIIDRAAETWGKQDGPPKLHYSDPWPGKPPGSHSQSVDAESFGAFLAQIRDMQVDVMLEVKDKEQSVLAIYERWPDLRVGNKDGAPYVK